MVREVVRAASTAGVPTRTVPGLYELISGRKSVSALRHVAIEDLLRRGAQVDLHFDEDSYAFARVHGRETIVVAINRAAAPKEMRIPAPYLEAREGQRLEPLLVARDRPAVAAGTLTLTVPPRTAVAYRLSDR